MSGSLNRAIFCGIAVVISCCFLSAVFLAELLPSPRTELGVRMLLLVMFLVIVVGRAFPPTFRGKESGNSLAVNLATVGGQFGMAIITLSLLFDFYRLTNRWFFISASIVSLGAWLTQFISWAQPTFPKE